MPSLILALDTCTRRVSLAVRDADAATGRIHLEHSFESAPSHAPQNSAAVARHVQAALALCGFSAGDVAAVGVGIGPGSFTGVRCGLAVAKGFALARAASLIGVSAFEIILAAQPGMPVPVAALIEIGRNRVAVQRFAAESRQPTGMWSLMTPQAFAESLTEPTWVCGDVPHALLEHPPALARFAPAPHNVRRAAWLAELAAARLKSGQTSDPMTLAPIYPPEAA